MHRTIISIVLTFLLGPGVGHVYLRLYKRGIALFLITLVSGLMFVLEAIRSSGKPLTADQSPMLLLQDFYASNPKTVFIYDIIFAAIWAFAFIDVFYKSGGIEVFKKKVDKQNNENDNG